MSMLSEMITVPLPDCCTVVSRAVLIGSALVMLLSLNQPCGQRDGGTLIGQSWFTHPMVKWTMAAFRDNKCVLEGSLPKRWTDPPNNLNFVYI